jgi:mRNA interferase MazF
VTTIYVPEKGHFIWLNFSPHDGHEQAGRRPALVLSPRSFNNGRGLAMVCPITNTVRNSPFEVRLPQGMTPQGVILCDQVRTLDWRARNAQYIGVATAQHVNAAVAKVAAILGI